MWRYHRLPRVASKLQHFKNCTPAFGNFKLESSFVRSLTTSPRNGQIESVAVKSKGNDLSKHSSSLYQVGQNIEGFVVQEVRSSLCYLYNFAYFVQCLIKDTFSDW